MKHKLNLSNVNIDDIYYQLLTATCGTLTEAEKYKCKNCMFLIVQIIPHRNIQDAINGHKIEIKKFLTANNEVKSEDKIKSGYSTRLKTDNNNYKAYLGYVEIERK